MTVVYLTEYKERRGIPISRREAQICALMKLADPEFCRTLTTEEPEFDAPASTIV